MVETHAVRLLEAQIATGGIIDPVANHRLPVEVAFERGKSMECAAARHVTAQKTTMCFAAGLFDEKLNRVLEDPSDDTKGFFDPNTNENLTYLQLMKRCIIDAETELLLIPINCINMAMTDEFKPCLAKRKSRDDITFQSGWRKTVKLTDLVNARVITESKIKELEEEQVCVQIDHSARLHFIFVLQTRTTL